MAQNIIISQVPDTDNLLESGKLNNDKSELKSSRMSAVWQRWLNLLQLFINQYFPPFMVTNTDKGNTPRIAFSLPAMSQTDRDALSNLPVTGIGLIILNTTTNAINYYQNGVWAALP